ncbi:MAG: CocE/NonD family hydrolase [Thermoleophilaceae bacterium]
MAGIFFTTTRLRRVHAFALLALVGACWLAAAPAHAADSTKLPDVTIPASDGVNLVGDVYLPGAGTGKYPAVIDMEPYGRSTSTAYVSDGYARVNTDVRGSGKSGGALCLLCSREQQDVYDVVEWVARQPWSNGHVALYGYSYSAITSLLGAALQPPHLDAVVVGHPPTDPYRDVVWHNGLFDQGFVGQWFAGQTAAQSVGIGVQPQILDRAQQEFAIEARLEPLDGPLYYERSVLAKLDRITVPVYVFTGWEDMYSRGDLWFIDGVASRNKLLVIDPSTHHGTGEFGEVGAPYGGSPQDQLKNPAALSSEPPPGEDTGWLDRFVKGVQNGIESKPRVRYFDLGDSTWHAAPTWRSVTTRNQTLYLSAHKSGSATLSPNDGTLADSVPTGRDSYQDMSVYNPAAGASIPADKDGPDGFLPFVPLDQRLDEPFGLNFTTPALKQPLPLAGPSELRFWTILEDTDMPYIGRLVDVAPDGSSRLITQGWLRASFRSVDPARSRPGKPYLPDDHQEPVTIGLPTEYRMDIWDTAYTLQPGHRLRLWLSFSDTPTHEPLPVTGRILLLHDRDHPSQLILGTRLPGPAPSAATRGAPVKCPRRARILARIPKGLRKVHVTVDGKRARIANRGHSRVVRVRPRAGARFATVRIRGVDRHGRHVKLRRRYSACR